MNAHTPIAPRVTPLHPVDQDAEIYSAIYKMEESFQVADELVRVIMFLDPDIFHDSRDVSMVLRLTFLIKDEIEKARELRSAIIDVLHPRVHPKEAAQMAAWRAEQAAS